MNRGTAFFDEKGEIACTASGKGGGGAWGLLLDCLDKAVEPRWLLAVLNSGTLWEWIRLEGDPKKGGWRGVDKALICRLPIPVPSQEIQEHAARLTLRMEDKFKDKFFLETLSNDLNEIVTKAFKL